MADEPYPGLMSYQSVQIVQAGEITEIVASGCYVKTAAGTRDGTGDSVLLPYEAGMDSGYVPQLGDFWVITKRMVAIVPRAIFLQAFVENTEPPVASE